VPTLWQEDLRAPPAEKIDWNDLSERVQREFLREFVGVAQTAAARPIAERGAPTKPVELSFVEGSVTQSSASALVLGAFANVEPTGAAQAIDRILHGAISDLARRRAISAAAGEVFVLPVGRRGLAARLVVFAGLGDFARYGPDVQRLAAANVTRTLALAGVDDFAMVLWGTASGADAADAALVNGTQRLEQGGEKRHAQHFRLAQDQGIEAQHHHAGKRHCYSGQRKPADPLPQQDHREDDGHRDIGLLGDRDGRDVF